MITVLVASSSGKTLAEETLSNLGRQDDLLVLQVIVDGPHIASASRRLGADILLLDCRLLTHSSESELAALLDGLGDVKVLVICGHAHEAHARLALQLGMRGILNARASAACLSKAIRALNAGDWWFSRRTLGYFLSEIFDSRTASDALSSAEHRLGKEALTDRELGIIRLVAEGMTNKEVGTRLGISPATVKCHMSHIFRKLQIKRRAKLAQALSRQAARPDIPSAPGDPDGPA